MPFMLFILLVLAVVAIASGLRFNTAFIPGPIDESLRPEGSITKTAAYNGAAQSFGVNYAAGGVGQPMAAVVQITAVDRTTGDETYTYKVQESTDGGNNWTDASPSVVRTAIGAFSIPFFLTGERARVVLATAGTTPSVTYETAFVPIQ